jgi:hypothetical protein
LFFYLFGFKNSFKNGNVNELYKNPYRPMRKELTVCYGYMRQEL